ncbi:MAG: hypothetical protein ACERKZ_11170 [Lachnotalea sp.]
MNNSQQKVQSHILEMGKMFCRLLFRPAKIRMCLTEGIQIDVKGEFANIELADKTLRQPNWKREEVVILVSEYFRTKNLCKSDQLKSIEFISNTLRTMAKRNGLVIDKKYRNVIGIEMKFANIKSLDNDYITSGYSGLKNVSMLEKTVVGEYYISPEKISQEAYFVIMKYVIC